MTLLALASGCDYFSGKRQRAWSEEVRLDDGSSITVDRFVAFEESNALGGGVYISTETKPTLRFRSELASLPEWDVPLIPLVLYRDPVIGEWVIVATTSRCEVPFARTVNSLKGKVTMIFIAHVLPRGLQVDEVFSFGQRQRVTPLSPKGISVVEEAR